MPAYEEGLGCVPGKASKVLGDTDHFDVVFVANGTVSSTSCVEDELPSDSSSSADEMPSRKEQTQYCIKVSIISAIVGAILCGILLVCRDYIKYMLLWMENVNLGIATVIFAILFIIISFPMMWGYVLLNVAAGYLYGLLLGTLLVSVCALIGISVAHEVTKKFLSDYVMSKLVSNESLRALVRVVEGQRGFKVVALARLTPIPFGLQNGLFAISKIGIIRYLFASITGLMPTQILNSYIGTTLRSMEEVLTDSSNTLAAYIIFAIQLLLTVALMFYVVRRARAELNKTMEEHDKRPNNGECGSDGNGALHSNGNVKTKLTANGFYTQMEVINEKLVR